MGHLGNTLSGVVFMGLGYWYYAEIGASCSAKNLNQIISHSQIIKGVSRRGPFAYILSITRPRLSDRRRRGDVAERKARSLSKGARLTVNALTFIPVHRRRAK